MNFTLIHTSRFIRVALMACAGAAMLLASPLHAERADRTKPITLEAARPQIVRFLTYDQIRDLLEKLRGRAKVQVMVKTDTPAQAIPPADAPKSGVSPGVAPSVAPPAAPVPPLKGAKK